MHAQKKRRRLTGTLVALALTLATGVAGAQDYFGEPFNDREPTFTPAKVIFQHHYYGLGTGGWRIDSGSDVDWFVLACSQDFQDQAPRFLDRVSIRGYQGTGDLDIDVFLSNGTSIGGSYSTTSNEEVTFTQNYTSVFLRVHGYAGATGPYDTNFNCR